MQLVDVNVLVYAHREDTPEHAHYLSWLGRWIDSDTAFGMSDLVLSEFLRVVTHPHAYPAALANESGSEWITTDRDYSRFDGLRWRHPLD